MQRRTQRIPPHPLVQVFLNCKLEFHGKQTGLIMERSSKRAAKVNGITTCGAALLFPSSRKTIHIISTIKAPVTIALNMTKPCYGVRSVWQRVVMALTSQSMKATRFSHGSQINMAKREPYPPGLHWESKGKHFFFTARIRR